MSAPKAKSMSADTGATIHRLPAVHKGAAMPDDERFGDAPETETGAPKITPNPTKWDRLFRAVDPKVFTTRPPPRTYLLTDRATGKGAIVAGKASLFVAEGGAGKTMALTNLAVCVAAGTPWLETLVPTKAGRVLLIAGEEDGAEIDRRLYAARQKRGPAPKDDAIMVLPLAAELCAMLRSSGKGKDLEESEFLYWLRARIAADVAEHGPFALVILDPLSRFAGPEAETDNAAGTTFVTIVESLIAVSGGAAIIVAHHSNKAAREGSDGKAKKVTTSAARGSSALTDGFRAVLTMGVEFVLFKDPAVRERLGEIVTVTHTKSNYTRKFAPILLRRDNDNEGALVALDDTDREWLREQRGSKGGSMASGNTGTVASLAEAVAVIATENPGIGTVALRAKVKDVCPGVGVERITEATAYAEELGRIENRVEMRGKRPFPHYFATAPDFS